MLALPARFPLEGGEGATETLVDRLSLHLARQCCAPRSVIVRWIKEIPWLIDFDYGFSIDFPISLRAALANLSTSITQKALV